MTKLYHHKTDGGAEYLCLKPIEGTDEGDLHTAIARLDGEPELFRFAETSRTLRPYSKWIGKTSAERELVNVIKLALEHLGAMEG